MDADKLVLDDLQKACGTLSSLKEQYRVDAKWLKVQDIEYVASCVKDWYKDAEKHLGIFIKRLLYYDEQPVYPTAPTQSNTTVEALLTREYHAAYRALDFFNDARLRAWEKKAGYTPDEFEHAIRDMEYAVFAMDRELKLIKKLGEKDYIGARLADG